MTKTKSYDIIAKHFETLAKVRKRKCVGPWKLNNENRKKPVMTLSKDTQIITVRCTLQRHQEIHGYVSILNERLKL